MLIGHGGLITLDTVAWLQGVGVPLIHLDHDGRLYFVSSPVSRSVAQFSRAQVRAADTERGLAISRALLAAKIERQQQVLSLVPEGAMVAPQLAEALERVQHAPSVPVLRDWEAKAARAYWRAWRSVPKRFAPADAQRRPAHWRVFGSRRSPLAQLSPRKAVNPRMPC